jgi:integrase
VRGFWSRWADEHDPQWGAGGVRCPERHENAIYTFRSKTRQFAEMYAERQLSTLSDTDIVAYTESAAYKRSHMTPIHTFLEDAQKAGLRRGVNPVAQYARMAERGLRQQRDRKRNESDPPSLPQIDALLTRLSGPAYPRSLYGWFLTGSRTGMRGGELDGMRFEDVDFDAATYRIRKQLHPRTGRLAVPKHDSVRTVLLDDDIMREIRAAGAQGLSEFIWTNTSFDPWRHTSRSKWWAKQIDGSSLRETVGDATMYEATRHHWASWAVNEGGMSPYQASILYGHSDGGKLISEIYASPDNDAAIEAARRAAATRPSSLTSRRRAA